MPCFSTKAKCVNITEAAQVNNRGLEVSTLECIGMQLAPSPSANKPATSHELPLLPHQGEPVN